MEQSSEKEFFLYFIGFVGVVFAILIPVIMFLMWDLGWPTIRFMAAGTALIAWRIYLKKRWKIK